MQAAQSLSTKLVFLSFIGLSQQSSELFMTEKVVELQSQQQSLNGIQESQELYSVGMGICQAIKDFEVFDLKQFALLNKNGNKPSIIQLASGQIKYELCGVPWSLEADDFASGKVDPTCSAMDSKERGNMYYLDSTSKCQYSFENADFNVVDDDNFSLTYKSKQVCGLDARNKFVFTLSGQCSQDATSTKVTSESDCAANVLISGPEACKLFTLPGKQTVDFFNPFIGAFLILMGLLLVFLGFKLITNLLNGFVCLSSSVVFFMSVYNSTPFSNVFYVILLILFSGCVGFAITYLTKDFAKIYVTSILGAWGGCSISNIFVQVFQIKGPSIILWTVAGIGFGAYLGKQLNWYSKCIGSSIVGSSLVVEGFYFYIEKSSPESFNADFFRFTNPFLYFFSTIFIALTVGGSFLQIYFFKKDQVTDEDYIAMNMDDIKYQKELLKQKSEKLVSTQEDLDKCHELLNDEQKKYRDLLVESNELKKQIQYYQALEVNQTENQKNLLQSLDQQLNCFICKSVLKINEQNPPVMVLPCQHFFCGECHNNKALNNNGCSQCSEPETQVVQVKFLGDILDKYYAYKKPFVAQEKWKSFSNSLVSKIKELKCLNPSPQ